MFALAILMMIAMTVSALIAIHNDMTAERQRVSIRAEAFTPFGASTRK